VICPVRYAFALADAWPGVVMDVIGDAGHSSLEPGIAAALVAATNRFAASASFAR
jgi:proline iminopeptidase